MIIKKDGNIETRNDKPNSDWYEEGNLIIDETTEEGQQMSQTVIDNYPFVDFKVEGKQVTEVIVLDKPEKPVPDIGQEVDLTRNEQGQWEYVLIDTPLTEVEILKKEIAEQKALINAMLGVTE